MFPPITINDNEFPYTFIFRVQNMNQNHKNNIYKTDYLTEVTEAT